MTSWFKRVASRFTGPPSGRLDSKQLPSICFLGKGLSGFVYETKWKGDKYARKDFPLGSVRSNFVFLNEARSLLDLDHRNIVRCFGYTVGDSSCSLVQEYVDDDLLNTMQRRIEAQRNKNSSSSSSSFQLRIVDADEIKRLLEVRNIPGVDEGSSETPGKCTDPFDSSEALDIISQIAVGMKYLHNNGVVHGDLKPKNVLLCSESGAMKVKVTDFGLIETKKRIRLVSKRTQHLGILMWKAPERFEELMGPLTEDSDDPLTDSDTDEVSEDLIGLLHLTSSEVEILKMADVYSFGLTCSHILGGKLLYPDFSLTKLRKQRMHGFRPELPSSTCPDDLKLLIYLCLEFEPWKRPTFSFICFLLEALGRFPRELEKGIARTGFLGTSLEVERFYNSWKLKWKAKGTNIVHFHMLLDASGWTSKEASSGDKESVWERLWDSFSRFVSALRPHDVLYFWAFNWRTSQLLCQVERKDFHSQLNAIRAKYMHFAGLALDNHDWPYAREKVEWKIQREADKELTSFVVPFIDGIHNSITFTANISRYVKEVKDSYIDIRCRQHIIYITFNILQNFKSDERLDQTKVSHIRCGEAEPNEISLAFDTLSLLIIDSLFRVPETIHRAGSSQGKKRMTEGERGPDDGLKSISGTGRHRTIRQILADFV